MKTDDDLFKKALKGVRDGPKYILPFQPEGSGLDRYNGHITNLVNHENMKCNQLYLGREKFAIPRVIGGTIDEGKGNAFALLDGDQYYLGVNWGASLLFEELFCRLFSYPEFMPWIGDVSKVYPEPLFDEHPLKQDITDTWNTFLKPFPRNYPQDPIRMRAAQCMSLVMHLSLICHELRHIYGGHLLFLKNNNSPDGSSNSTFSIDEIHSQNTTSEGGLIDQALERDSDRASVHRTLSYIGGWHTYLECVPEYGEMPEYGEFFQTHHQVVESVLLVHDIYFKIFDLVDSDHLSTWEKLTHPPMAVRRSMIVDWLVETVSHPKARNYRYVASDIRESIAPRVYSISEKLVNRIFGLPSRDIDFSGMSHEINEHKNKIEAAWQSISPDLSRLRYFDLTWDL